MKILIVCNNASSRGNGLFTALQSLMKNLKEAGLEARLLATENEDADGPQPDYPLKHFRFPIFEHLVSSNGYRFGSIDNQTLTKAVRWADVVHLQEAFPLESKVVEIAEELGKPCVATYHLFAQNVVANAVHGEIDNIINPIIDWFWKEYVFNRCSYIHCPTETVRRHLAGQGYKAQLEVFSNGISIPDNAVKASSVTTINGAIPILCIGRLAYEKSQQTLLDAMRYSAYADRIQLHFAGKGPMEQRCREKAGQLVRDGILRYEPRFGFYDKKELTDLIRHSYLYVHCAWAEVEGLSCLESIREGLVPLIAEGPLTATSQFALDERSIFPAHDARSLAARIDWWIEHPQERMKMGQAYADSARKYDIRQSTKAMIDMYRKALRAS